MGQLHQAKSVGVFDSQLHHLLVVRITEVHVYISPRCCAREDVLKEYLLGARSSNVLIKLKYSSVSGENQGGN